MDKLATETTPEASSPPDLWVVPTLMLWGVFMVVGLAPDYIFFALRDLGRVLTQNAMTNSVFAITFACSGYYAWFTKHRCMEGGLSRKESRGRAVQIFLIGLLAFLPVEYTVGLLIKSDAIQVRELRILVFMVAPGKIMAWLYLMSLIVLYYLFGIGGIFAQIPSVFPSSYRRQKSEPELLTPFVAAPEPTKESSGN